MKKLSILFVAAILAFTLSNCSKSGDPAPTAAKKTVLDSVKAVMTGTWSFKSLAVMEVSSGKSAVTSSCAKSELASAGFANTNWKSITPEENYTYSTGNAVQQTNNCATVNIGLTFTVVQNSDQSVTITFSNGDIYNVITKNITTNSIKAKYLTGSTTSGYVVVITFTKS